MIMTTVTIPGQHVSHCIHIVRVILREINGGCHHNSKVIVWKKFVSESS